MSNYTKHTLDSFTNRIVNGCYDSPKNALRAIARSHLSGPSKTKARKVVGLHYKTKIKPAKRIVEKRIVKRAVGRPRKGSPGKGSVTLNVQFEKAITIKITTE